MLYKITLKKQAIKSLEKIKEPYYSKIKAAIYFLVKIQGLMDVKNLKEEMVIESELLTKELFMIFSMKYY